MSRTVADVTGTPAGLPTVGAGDGVRPLRVVQIVTTLARGGAQATVLAALPGPGGPVEVTVLAGTDDPGEGTHWSDGGPMAAALVPVGPLRRSLRPLWDLWALVWLVRWLRAHRPDVVHTHSSKAGVLGRLAAAAVGIPAVHTVHGWSFAAVPAGAGPVRWLIRRAVVGGERFLARRCRALVVVSPLDAQEGLAHRIGAPRRYHVIRSGVDLTQPRAGALSRTAIREAEGWADGFVVGTVGRLAPQKDLLNLLDGFALARIPGAVLVVVGDGPQARDLRVRAEDLGLEDRVRFLGARSDAARIVAGFDVFALTSRWEGLPRTIVEAAAAGVPVVATAVGGVPELIRDGLTGTLIPVGDPAALARTLERVASDPDRYRAMAGHAAAAVEPFSVDTMRTDLIRLWSDVARRP